MGSLWEIVLNDYNYKNNRKYETIFTLSNGYRGFRGVQEFSKIFEAGNFIAGIFDKNDAQVTEIVNCQNPLAFNIYFDSEKVDIDFSKVLEFERKLNMKEGILYSKYLLKLPSGKVVKIETDRFVSRNNVHRWAQRYKITPVNFSGKMFIENIIDGTVTNSSFDVENKTKHLNVTDVLDLKPGIALKSKTIDKCIEIIETAYINCEEKGNIFTKRKFKRFGETARELYETYVKEAVEYVIVKYGTTYTSRDSDKDISELSKEELLKFLYDGYEKEKNLHSEKVKELWDMIDIIIKGDDEAQRGIRFNLYHLSSSAYDGDDRVSIAAKALHGEGYKGHVFWDTEIFMLPFFIYTNPKVARSLLMYRYNTLNGARENAKLNGYKGAQFPWESADDGLEVTPKWGFDYDGNPVRIWTGDEEFHINSDIAFGIWEYYRATGDEEFLLKYGIEIFLDTAKFWNSRIEYNEKYDRYEINKVIGPDEFHEHINNNVYTNYLAKWNIKKALQLVEILKVRNEKLVNRLCSFLGITEDDFKEWNEKANKIYIPMSKDGKIIEQFEGYFELDDIDIKEYDENGMPAWPDLKGLKLHETQLIKQADVIMLMLLLGDEFDLETKKINYEYYEKRTMHKSSLSPSMYSIMGLNVGDTHNSYKYFMKTIYTDLEDNQGNTDFGLHAASTGGSWQSAVFGFGGFSVDKDEIPNFSPWIPEKWNQLTYKINWKSALIKVSVMKGKVEIESSKDITIKVYGRKYEAAKNEKIIIDKH
ncbi:kojibiose phosphorylase [Caloramator quimbayensis]|uniref:Kojibiose phosphorylase n=1 Tax=Caloramator quimbayensis TaxID=1147123 RepID=A0A1T4WPS7_9CLOT|nr:glycosyl hydrolase family 65 protein [Caloramator quimbayensis]SKA78621.1 kojibiose phosphorylase [Caloramator quimbayensis]